MTREWPAMTRIWLTTRLRNRTFRDKKNECSDTSRLSHDACFYQSLLGSTSQAARSTRWSSSRATRAQSSRRLLRVLALKEEWFTDNLQHDLRGKDAKLHISGKLIVEMAELKQFRGAEVSTLKSFISLQEDKFRLPYGHRDVTIYRQCVFIGTTNDRDYLTDTTGNRRYFPVYIVRIDLERAKESIEQIYAEAIYRRETGENANWWLSADEEKLAKVEQRERLSDDAWAGRIAEEINRLAARAKAPTANTLYALLAIFSGWFGFVP